MQADADLFKISQFCHRKSTKNFNIVEKTET